MRITDLGDDRTPVGPLARGTPSKERRPRPRGTTARKPPRGRGRGAPSRGTNPRRSGGSTRGIRASARVSPDRRRGQGMVESTGHEEASPYKTPMRILFLLFKFPLLPAADERDRLKVGLQPDG